MTTTQQPEAIRLAEELKEAGRIKDMGRPAIQDMERKAADELRRLHARVVELEAELQLANQSSGAEAYEIACEEMEAFQKKRDEAGKDSGACNSLVEGMAWVYEALSRAEHQLSAIGAVGVETLRKRGKPA